MSRARETSQNRAASDSTELCHRLINANAVDTLAGLSRRVTQAREGRETRARGARYADN